MLKPEIAEAQIKKRYDAQHYRDTFERCGQLPPKLRDIVRGLRGRDHDNKEIKEWQKKNAVVEAAGKAASTLDESERKLLFDALVPALADTFEAIWNLFDRLPYTSGYERRAFRAPGEALLLQSHRVTLLHLAIDQLAWYKEPVEFFAEYAPYLTGWTDEVGYLCAAAIDAGGETGRKVYDILVSSAKGEHEIGAMGRHVVRGLLCASRPDGWEFMEKFLLAAQRNEGLRQVILETIDEAHPEAYRRMLRLILEHDLTRFSSVVRAVGVWTGVAYEVTEARAVTKSVSRLLAMLEEPETRAAASGSDVSEDVYSALMATAFDDVMAALPLAELLLQSENVSVRYVTALFLTQTGIDAARTMLTPLLDDPDLRVASLALKELTPLSYGEPRFENPSELFEAGERNFARFPRKLETGEPLAWGKETQIYPRSSVARILAATLGNRPPSALSPYLKDLDTYAKAGLIEKIGAMGARGWDGQTREMLFSACGDLDSYVRGKAFKAIETTPVESAEMVSLEGLLTRKSQDTRQAVTKLILKQKDAGAEASAERLLSKKDANQRAAGLEIAREMIGAGRRAETMRSRVAEYAAKVTKPTEVEQRLRDAILDVEREEATLKDALGLMAGETKTVPVRPKEIKGITTKSDSTARIAFALNQLIAEHAQAVVTIEAYTADQQQVLLGNVTWGFPAPNTQNHDKESEAARLPLHEVWLNFWDDRPKEMRDEDGRELLRWIVNGTPQYVEGSAPANKVIGLIKSVSEGLGVTKKPEKTKIQHIRLIEGILAWIVYLRASEWDFDFLLDAAETQLSHLTDEVISRKPKEGEYDQTPWRTNRVNVGWYEQAQTRIIADQERVTPAQWIRLWNLGKWLDEPLPGIIRSRPSIQNWMFAFLAGGATRGDAIDLLLVSGDNEARGKRDFKSLQALQTKPWEKWLDKVPALRELMEACRARIVEVEMTRGELPTAATDAVMSLAHSGGTEVFLASLKSLDKESFVRSGWWRYSYYGNVTRAVSFSHLLRVSKPDDLAAEFAQRAADLKISETRLVEAAMFAPQWAKAVEKAAGWDGLEEGIAWFHAHTKDTAWGVSSEVKEMWNAQMNLYTSLTAQELLDGAVDVAWFNRISAKLGEERWHALDAAAKYASGGAGHKRAQLFSDAMRGQTTKADLVSRIKDKRNQDALRALGLVPLETDAKEDTLDRYRVIQAFLRATKQFGSQRQVSEKLAASIALDNLARTAGYPDPVRLSWAMEREVVADLVSGSVSKTAGEVTVTLLINDLGSPEIGVEKAGKPLKSVPPAVKKNEEIAELLGRKTEITRQASRMRKSLEDAMIRGDEFTGEELRHLMTHPVLRPLLRNLLFVSSAKTGKIGYPSPDGTHLEAHNGKAAVLSEADKARIAHPVDLLETGEWAEWQRDIFLRERVQPFKQVFRELYVPTSNETEDGTLSRRYAGHQVNPRQAVAMMGGRGWVNAPEEGLRRTYHAEGLAAYIEFNEYFTTPADVEGLTVEAVRFTRRNEWKPLKLDEIPPRLFSETMRDVDLMVSVAHMGGVDPEASASTTEMREALIRETCRLLKIENVRFDGKLALVDGFLGTYSVHLGSATVHKLPGGYVCLVPVHGQHRGRLFLPFADDDPRTAECVSKVILLAKDKEIKDPILLEQLLRK